MYMFDSFVSNCSVSCALLGTLSQYKDTGCFFSIFDASKFCYHTKTFCVKACFKGDNFIFEKKPICILDFFD